MKIRLILSLTLIALIFLLVTVPQAEKHYGSEGGEGERVERTFEDHPVIEERRARYGQAPTEYVAIEPPARDVAAGSISFAAPGGGTYSRPSPDDSAEHEYLVEAPPAEAPAGARAQLRLIVPEEERAVRQIPPGERLERREPGPVDTLREEGAMDFERWERAGEEPVREEEIP